MTRLSVRQAQQLGILSDKPERPKKIRNAARAPKESEIQAAIRDWLRWNKWFVVKIHQSLGSVRGIADLYALKNGRSVWIEVKTPAGRLSEHQEKFRDEVLAHGGEYLVARSVEDVEQYLRLTGGS